MAQSAAAANSQGFHFKLDVSQGETTTSSIEQKHKTFWISCPARSGAEAAAKDTEKSKQAKQDVDNDTDVAGVNDNDSDEVAAGGSAPIAVAAGSAPLAGRTGSSAPVVGGALGAHVAAAPRTQAPANAGVQALTAAAAPSFLAGVLGLATTPNTGAAVPFGLGSLLALAGLGALRIRRRVGEDR